MSEKPCFHLRWIALDECYNGRTAGKLAFLLSPPSRAIDEKELLRAAYLR